MKASAPDMPAWLQWIVWAAAGVTAIGLLWQKAVHPAVTAYVEAQVTRPVIRAIVGEFKDDLNHIAVLDEIAAQFKTNAGSSLKDAINRLESTASTSAAAVIEQKIENEATRSQMAQLRVLVDRLTAQVDLGLMSNIRLEQGAEMIASDLAASIKRADDEPSGEAGAAADAGLKSGGTD